MHAIVNCCFTDLDTFLQDPEYYDPVGIFADHGWAIVFDWRQPRPTEWVGIHSLQIIQALETAS